MVFIVRSTGQQRGDMAMNNPLTIKIRSWSLVLGICLACGMLAACGGAPTPEALATPTATETPRPTLPPTPTKTLPPTATSTPEPTHTPTVTVSPSPIPASPTPESGEISWEAAQSHIGETVAVCGPVVDARYASGSSGKPTFLNIGKKYPDPGRFTVLIWQSDRDKFASPPEQLYLGQTICVSGEIEEFGGLLEIVVEDPAQIEIR
jgi:hypothetical protein